MFKFRTRRKGKRDSEDPKISNPLALLTLMMVGIGRILGVQQRELP